nr:SMP-30/gluconolactonase/LRE family protein [uncultured Mucilaginibacter sp.]
MNFRRTAFAAIVIALGGFSTQAQPKKPLITVKAIDPAFNKLVSKTAKAEILAEGFVWSEGPLWIESQQMLLFSDVKKNRIYKWTKAKGKEVFLYPSGYTGKTIRGGELGSNGLGLSPDGKLIICQDGNRLVVAMDAPLDKPKSWYKVIASNYKGLKFDSPNDLDFLTNGDIYFTDPPYGLEKNVDDPLKEAKYQGVYRIAKKDGKVTLLTTEITRPNGIAFFPGQKRVLIANSDPLKPDWYVYDLDKDGLLINKKTFFTAQMPKEYNGVPDGLKIDKDGNVFATGPGGIFVLNSAGKLLGKIEVDDLASNCSFSADQKTLYVTNNHRVIKIALR